MRLIYTLLFILLPLALSAQKKGSVIDIDGHMTITHIARHQAYSRRDSLTYDTDIRSPKSVTLNPEGTRYYINSLEGHRTVAYDASTHQKLAVIRHRFTKKDSLLWAPASGFYTFN